MFGSQRKNGSWTGLVGDVVDGRADVIVAYLSLTFSRAQAVDYSTLLLKFSYRIFVRPSEDTSFLWTAYTRPFSSGLWALTMVTLLFFAVSGWIISLKTTRPRQKELRRSYALRVFLEAGLLSWASITQQGWSENVDTLPKRIMFWTAYMTGVILVASYSATLVSFLTVGKTEVPFDSVDTLIQHDKYRLGILKGSVLQEIFESDQFRYVWDKAIAPHSDTVAMSYGELRERTLKDSNFVFVGTYEIQRLDFTGACIFQAAKQHIAYNDGALGWRKGSPYVHIFDYYLGVMREAGMLKKLKDYYYNRPYMCPNRPYMALNIQQVFTAFLVLLIGMCAGILFLMAEKFIQILWAIHGQNDKTTVPKTWKSQRLKGQFDNKDLDQS
ncbi:putative glutamate receptor isoform X2 [Oratosquilla oratoria]|uniref:putative glutamate receptor isoform X2 n=1 Tax=Oratosquilla oratoria TaxID=337810 RepID=UPI003F75C51F